MTSSRYLYLIVTLCLLSVSGVSQTVIVRQGFEAFSPVNAWNYSGSPTIVTGIGTLPSTSLASEGSLAWGISNAISTLTFQNTSLLGYSSSYVQFRLAAFSMNTTGNGMEANDSVIVEVSIDGGARYSREVVVIGSTANNAIWDYSSTTQATVSYSGLNTPIIYQAVGSGQTTSAGVSTIRINVANATQVAIRITARNNSANERWCIDDLQVIGDAPSRLPIKLAMISVVPSRPFVGQPFSITVQAQDSAGLPQRVLEDTEIHVSLQSGSGVLTGNLVGVIEENETTAIISGISYSVLESNVQLKVRVVSGMALDSTVSLPIEFREVIPPTTLTITTLTPTTLVANREFALTIETQDSLGNRQPLLEPTVLQLFKHSGSGNLSGIVTLTAPAGQSLFTFTGLRYSVAEDGVSFGVFNLGGTELTPDTTVFLVFSEASVGVQQRVLFADQQGTALLNTIITSYKPSSTPSYDVARNYLYTDIYNVNGRLSCVYTGFTISFTSGSPNGINCEHTYPQSKGASGQARSDMHHLYPTRPDVNSDRGNFPFGDITDNAVQWWYRDTEYRRTTRPTVNITEYSRYASGVFQPRDDHKGNVARAMYYFYTMYKSQADAADPNYFNMMRNTLYRWHYEDPVDSAEYARTEKIARYQGGKVNPYVLDSTLIRRAYFPSISASTEKQIPTPSEFVLYQNYPNPFNPSTTVRFQLNRGERISLSIIDMLGRSVAELYKNERLEAGMHQIEVSSSRFALSSGVYLVRLASQSKQSSIKMLLVK